MKIPVSAQQTMIKQTALTGIKARLLNNLMYYIYSYTNPETSEIFYIGKGKNKRAYAFKYHHQNKSLHTYLTNLLTKYTGDQIVRFIESDLTEDVAHDREKYHIAKIGKKMDGGTLFNILDGGTTPPDQTGRRWKLSESAIYNQKQSWTPSRKQQQSIRSKAILRYPAWCSKISDSKRKFIFDVADFEQLVLSGMKLKDVLNHYSISIDIIRDRLLINYQTKRFREVVNMITSRNLI
jgi:hypothetical protein